MHKVAKEDDEARRCVAHAKQALSFTVDWQAAGHPAVEIIENMSGWADHFNEGLEKYPYPVVIKSLDIQMATVVKTLSEWETSSNKHCNEKFVDRVSSTLKVAQGLSELDTVWKQILPGNLQLQECLPSTKAVLVNTSLYTHTNNFHSCDWENQFLGSVKHHASGHCAYLLFPITTFATGLKAILKSPALPSTDEMKNWADRLDVEALSHDKLQEFLRAGLQVYHIKSQPGETLVVPAGFLVACTALSGKPVSGWRRPFLPKGSGSIATFSALAKACKDNPTAFQFASTTLDALTVASKAKA